MVEDFKHRVLREQIRLAMEQLPTMQGTSLIVALVLCYTVRNIVPHASIFEWGALVLVITLGRIALYHRFSKVRDGLFAGDSWKKCLFDLGPDFGNSLGVLRFYDFPVRQSHTYIPLRSCNGRSYSRDDPIACVHQVCFYSMGRACNAALRDQMRYGEWRIWIYRRLPDNHLPISRSKPCIQTQ